MPLSYASATTVLSHTDPNVRIQWSLKSRNMESIEKLVPLKCNHIQLDVLPRSTNIDGVLYEFGIVLKFENEKNMPGFIRRANANGGRAWDIDKTGHISGKTETIVEPGDVVLDDFSDDESDSEDEQPLNGFEPLIVFRVRGEVIKRLVYNKTIVETQRYFNTRLFGNRSYPIETKRLTLGQKIIRLPEGVKFHVKELDLGFNSMKHFENLKAILTPNSFPLNYLKIYHVTPDSEEYNHPAVKSAGTLAVMKMRPDGLLNFFTKLRNKTILNESSLSVEDHIALIEDWKTNIREVGSSITFETMKEDEVEKILNAITEVFDCRDNGDGDMFIALNSDTDLRITAGDDKGEAAMEMVEGGAVEEDVFSFFKMEVVPRAEERLQY